MVKKSFITSFAVLAAMTLTTSCSNDDVFDASQDLSFAQYEAKFIQKFGKPSSTQTWGFEDEARALTRANNPGEGFAETSTGINANANEWADPTPGKTYGGLVVPDPLTEKQKALVARYFQTVNDLKYEDPHWRNFFVQQVHKGGNTQKFNTTEGIKAADGSNSYTSDNMNLLSVGYNGQHINNFNHGTYGVEAGSTYGTVGTTGVGVLDKGWTANDFGEHHHMDQIMLMANIDDTECMGYHCSATGVSLQRNDKAALVSWQTIRSWARENGIYEEDILNDGWNRSFVGFDLALKSLDESYAKGNNGEPLYAMLSEVPNNNNMQYAWDGTNLMKIGTKPQTKEDQNITNILQNATLWQNAVAVSYNSSTGNWDWTGNEFQLYNLNIDLTGYTKLVIEYAEATTKNYNIELSVEGYLVGWDQNRKSGETKVEIDITNATKLTWMKFYNGGATKIKRIYLTSGANDLYYDSEYLLGNGQQLRYMDSNMNQYAGKSRTLTDNDLQTYQDGKLCLNLQKINELVSDGYLPVKGSAMKTWAKWEDSDGYFSDWIVTLSEAKKINNPYVIRVMAEDLTVQDINSDFDFNDIVFDVKWLEGGAQIRIVAAGGTLPLTIGGQTGPDGTEVHAAFQEANPDKVITTKTMINTAAGHKNDYKYPVITLTGDFKNKTGENAGKNNANLIRLFVNKGTEAEPKWVEMTAETGRTAAKFGVDPQTEWCDERQDIEKRYPDFGAWVRGEKSFFQ